MGNFPEFHGKKIKEGGGFPWLVWFKGDPLTIGTEDRGWKELGILCDSTYLQAEGLFNLKIKKCGLRLDNRQGYTNQLMINAFGESHGITSNVGVNSAIVHYSPLVLERFISLFAEQYGYIAPTNLMTDSAGNMLPPFKNIKFIGDISLENLITTGVKNMATYQTNNGPIPPSGDVTQPPTRQQHSFCEKCMQELIATYPDEFFPNDDFSLIGIEHPLNAWRVDILFKDPHGYEILVEIKRGNVIGNMERAATAQLSGYYTARKAQLPNQRIRMILCANMIPIPSQNNAQTLGIECKTISEDQIISVANKHNVTLY